MSNRTLRIRLGEQRLELCSGGRVLGSWPVSTALRGAGERMGSLQTPRGAHEVCALIGTGQPRGAVFRSRVPTGEVCTAERWAAEPGRDWILSRVIELSGLEPGRNQGGDVDTRSRQIYIHGTPDAEPMGVPRSHGCIRMRNQDVIALFEELRVGDRVLIED